MPYVSILKNRRFIPTLLSMHLCPSYSGFINAAFCLQLLSFCQRMDMNSFRFHMVMNASYILIWPNKVEGAWKNVQIHRLSPMTTSFFIKILKCHVEHLTKTYRQSVDNIVEANKHLSILKALILCARQNIPIMVVIKLLQSGRLL